MFDLIPTTTLFALAEAPTTQNWPKLDVRGLAECRCGLPELFLLLLGAHARACVWPATQAVRDMKKPHAGALIAEYAQALQILQRLRAHVTESLAQRWDECMAMMQKQRLPLICLVPNAAVAAPQGSRVYAAALRAIADGATRLAAAPPEAWAALLREARAWGAWHEHVDYLVYDDAAQRPEKPPEPVQDYLDEEEIERMPRKQRAAALAKGWVRYDYDGCYRVHPPAAAQGVRGVGLLTHYGRWLIRPEAGFDDFDVSTRGWIVAARLKPEDAAAAPLDENRLARYERLQRAERFLFDANGAPASPRAFAQLYIVNESLAQYKSRLEDKRWRLLRLESLEEVPGVVLDEIYANDEDASLWGKRGEAHALLDASGVPLTEFVFHAVHAFDKKHGLAIVTQFRGDAQFKGLIDRSGRIVAPLTYHDIQVSARWGAPRFVKGRVWALTARDTVTILDAKGKQLTPPYKMLNPAQFYLGSPQENLLVVAQANDVAELSLGGDFGSALGDYDTMRAEVLAQYKAHHRAAWRKPERLTHEQIAQTLRRDAFYDLLALLCEDTEALRSAWTDFVARLDDPGKHPEGRLSAELLGGAGVEHWFMVCEVSWPYPSAFIDHNGLDELPQLSRHFPELKAAQGFRLKDEDAGMEEGFAAFDRHLAKKGYRLISIESFADLYALGAIRAERYDTLLQQAQALSVLVHGFS
jgi:hypothetical protein